MFVYWSGKSTCWLRAHPQAKVAAQEAWLKDLAASLGLHAKKLKVRVHAPTPHDAPKRHGH